MAGHAATVVEQIGAFLARTRYEDLPRDVADAVKTRILDLLGASCAGIQAGAHTRLLELLPGDGEAPVWGTGASRPAREAILINAAVSHAVYIEDGSRFTGGHPSSAVIPAALTLAASRHADGKALVTAVACGYEVFLRLGHAIYPATVKRGFQSTAILAAPAAAAALASLLRLPVAAAAHAIAIGCSQGAGLKEALKCANSQPLQVGRSAEGGALACLYAASGATGVPDIVEHGFLKAFAGDADAGSITTGLGSRWHVLETYLKQYGGCRGNHAAIDAVAGILDTEKIGEDDIEHIDIRVDTVTYAAAVEPPRDAGQAQFSIAFSVAVRIVAGDVLPGRFSEEILRSPRVQSMMARIHVMPDGELDQNYPQHRPAVARLRLRNGQELTHRLDYARGEPESPLSMVEVERKFERLATPVYGASVRAISDCVRSLATLDDAATLAGMLAPMRQPSALPAR